MVADGLPENTWICFRVAAVTSGRGAQKSEFGITCKVRVLATPNKDGGFIGPLGPAAKGFPHDRNTYKWIQQKGQVEMKVPILENWKAGDIRLTKKTPDKIELSYVS